MGKEAQSPSGAKIVTVNKKARFKYELLETFEAGIVLSGAEIKSIRQGDVNLSDSYVAPYKGELFLVGAHISPYKFQTDSKYEPKRHRKLLMHRHEIDRLRGKVEEKGLTLVPTKLYLKRGMAKIEFALARGKHAPDKRATIKEREANREAERAMKMRNR